MENLVSIIMPAYNAASTIIESIESVLRQDYLNWELLVIDDKSTDNTVDLVSQYKTDKRVKLISLKENAGVANARNRGLLESKGRFVAFLDSDDVWISNKLSKQICEMINNNSHASCTSYELIDIESKKVNKSVLVNGEITYDSLLKGSKIGCLTVILDLNHINIEDIMMKKIGHEDYAVWLNIAKKYGNFLCLPEVLAEYRVFENSLSGNKLKVISWQYNIYREYLNIPVLKSMYYMFHYGVNSYRKYTSL